MGARGPQKPGREIPGPPRNRGGGVRISRGGVGCMGAEDPSAIRNRSSNVAVLELQGVEAYYGRVRALSGISLSVDRGEVVALIGSNGAGKTTTLRTISGLIAPPRGAITFEGQDITAVPAARRVQLGICHVPEGRRLFPRMTVDDNLTLGAYTRGDGAGIQQDRERVFELFPRLRERRTQISGTLSGGEQQMLAI